MSNFAEKNSQETVDDNHHLKKGPKTTIRETTAVSGPQRGGGRKDKTMKL